MTILAAIVGLALLSIAAFHFAWGFGVTFPAADEKSLVRLAVGATGRTTMPTPLQCFAAATAIAGCGVLAFLLAAINSPPALANFITWIGLIAGLIFALRGLAAYLPAWRRRFALEPFSSLDRRYYGPLCFLFSIGFVILSIQHFGAKA